MTIWRTASKSSAVPPRKLSATHTMDRNSVQPAPRPGAARRASIMTGWWGALPPTRRARPGSEVRPDLVRLYAKPLLPRGGIRAASLPQECEQVQPLQPIMVAGSNAPGFELQTQWWTNRGQARIQLGLIDAPAVVLGIGIHQTLLDCLQRGRAGVEALDIHVGPQRRDRDVARTAGSHAD